MCGVPAAAESSTLNLESQKIGRATRVSREGVEEVALVKKPNLEEARLDVKGDETERRPAAEQVVLWLWIENTLYKLKLHSN